MKFSDMMGKGERAATEATDATDTVEVPTSDAAAPPIPEAPIQFGDQRVRPADAPTARPVPRMDAASANLSMAEVAAELAPRRNAPVASAQQIDASAWLEDLTGIDDDLLPS